MTSDLAGEDFDYSQPFEVDIGRAAVIAEALLEYGYARCTADVVTAELPGRSVSAAWSAGSPPARWKTPGGGHEPVSPATASAGGDRMPAETAVMAAALPLGDVSAVATALAAEVDRYPPVRVGAELTRTVTGGRPPVRFPAGPRGAGVPGQWSRKRAAACSGR